MLDLNLLLGGSFSRLTASSVSRSWFGLVLRIKKEGKEANKQQSSMRREVDGDEETMQSSAPVPKRKKRGGLTARRGSVGGSTTRTHRLECSLAVVQHEKHRLQRVVLLLSCRSVILLFYYTYALNRESCPPTTL